MRPDVGSSGLEEEIAKQRIAFVDVHSSVEERAKDIAETRLADEQTELKGRGLRTIFKRIWKEKAYEYYRQLEIAKAREEIEGKKNLYVDKEGETPDDTSAHEAAMEAVVERFTDEYAAEMEHEGEKSNVVTTPDLQKNVSDVISAYAKGEIDDAELTEERARIFSQVSGVSADQIKQSVGYVDNFLAVAREARHAVEHGRGIEQLDLQFEIVAGQAKAGVRSESQLNRVDSLIDRIKNTKMGSFVNETTLALGIAAVYSTVAAVAPALRSKAVAWTTFGATAVVSAGFAAARENKRLKEERTQHNRNRAQGETFDQDAKRRSEMEQYRYETRSSKELVEAMQSDDFYKIDESGKLVESSEVTGDQVHMLVASIAEIEARIQVSDREKIDLISYSDVREVEQERLQLYRAQARAKVALRRIVASGKVADLDLGEHADADRLLESMVNMRVNGLMESEISEKDAAFNKMKRGRVGRKALTAVVTGLTIGAAVEEGAAFLRGDKLGLVENFTRGYRGESSTTALEGLRRWMTGEKISELVHFAKQINIGPGVGGLPEGVDLAEHVSGNYTLTVDGLDTIRDIKVNSDGTIAEESKRVLENNGFRIRDTTVPITGEGAKSSVTVGSTEYVQKHPELFKDVKRSLWYDNDTPKPVFDKNELKLWWGGDKNTGVDAQGNFVFNVAHMMPKGSYHGLESVNSGEANKSNTLKMLLSLSRETQSQVVEIDIDANGNAIIPKDSEVAKLFFGTDDKGKAIFKGRYAEVAQMMGSKDGTDQVRLLATHEGKGIKEVTDTVTSSGVKKSWVMDRFKNVLDSHEQDTDLPIEAPWFIPVTTRQPLEGKQRTSEIEGYYMNSYYGGKVSEELAKLFEKKRSETLKNNPNAKLDPYNEERSYLEKLDKKSKKLVNEFASSLGPMNPECRLSVCIPVAGHQEGENIYKSLESYARQNADPRSFEVVLFVNHPEKDKQGNPIVPDKTLTEIDRFKADYPNVQIKMLYKALPVREAKIGNIRKLLNDSVLLRQYNRGENAQDLIMVSNDADNKGISPDYISNFINEFNKHPEADAMLGQLDWDPEAYAEEPVIHIGTRLFQYLNAIGRRRSGGMSTSGANTAFRGSMYAAIGGYASETEKGEDINIGRAIVAARGRRDSIRFAGAKRSRVYTSARRAIDAWKTEGLPPVLQWETGKGFSAFDDEVRRLKLSGEQVNYDDPETQDKLKRALEEVINKTLDDSEASEKIGKDAPGYYKKALGLLGIQYDLDNKGDVVITNMSKLLDNLKGYQEYAVALRDMKSGIPEAAQKVREFFAENSTEEDQEDQEEQENSSEDDSSLNLDVSAYRVPTETLKSSTNTEQVGEYTEVKDMALSNQETGSVYRGYKNEGSEQVVVKELTHEALVESQTNYGALDGSTDTELYLINKNFEHPNVLMPLERMTKGDSLVRVYEAGAIDLSRYMSEGNTVSYKEALSILIRISNGLSALHREGVVHADVAPLNIILSEHNAQLTDLDGGSVRDPATGLYGRNVTRGNRFIMPPEMFDAQPRFNETVDSYEAAATLYRILSGAWPYSIESPAVQALPYEDRMARYAELHRSGNISFPESIPDELRPVIRKAMSPNPADRYASMEEFTEALNLLYNSLENGADTESSEESDLPPNDPGVRREKWDEIMGKRGELQKVVDSKLLSSEEGQKIRKMLRNKEYDALITELKERWEQQSTAENKSRIESLINSVGKLGFSAHDAKRRLVPRSLRKNRP